MFSVIDLVANDQANASLVWEKSVSLVCDTSLVIAAHI